MFWDYYFIYVVPAAGRTQLVPRDARGSNERLNKARARLVFKPERTFNYFAPNVLGLIRDKYFKLDMPNTKGCLYKTQKLEYQTN